MMSAYHNSTTVNYDSESTFRIQSIFFYWSLIILGSISVALNSLFVAMLIIFRKKFLTQNNNKIILSMTVADDLVGFFCIIFAGALITKQSQTVYKLIGVIPLFGSMFISIFSITVMTLDRLIAIKIPLRHKNILTSKRVVRLILLCWLVPAFVTIQEICVYFAFSSKVELRVRGYILFVFFSIGSTLLTISNIYLYKTIERHACCMNNQRMAVLGRKRVQLNDAIDSRSDQFCIIMLPNSTRERRFQKQTLNEIKAARLCIKITVIFIACWIPLTSYRLTYSLGKKIGIAWLRRLFLLMAVSNSIMNPVVYLLTRSCFQKYMWLFLTRKYKFLRR